MRVTVNGKQMDVPAQPDVENKSVHVHVIATDNPPGGIGEVGLPPTSGAIGNAVAALTGARVRHLPMIPERVLAALRSS